MMRLEGSIMRQEAQGLLLKPFTFELFVFLVSIIWCALGNFKFNSRYLFDKFSHCSIKYFVRFQFVSNAYNLVNIPLM